MSTIWKCTRAQWDQWAVTEGDDRKLRPATAAELLGRKVVVGALDEDVVYFHVFKQEWTFADFPGKPISEGDAQTRFERLKPETRVRLTRVTVERKKGKKQEKMIVRADEVKKTDVVHSEPTVPVLLLGE